MTPNQSQWTKNELLAYILLYAANSDFKEVNTERNMIRTKVDRVEYQKIKDEFDRDSDYTCIQKIIRGLKEHQFTTENISELLVDLKLLFYSDGKFDINEQHFLMYLRKLIS